MWVERRNTERRAEEGKKQYREKKAGEKENKGRRD